MAFSLVMTKRPFDSKKDQAIMNSILAPMPLLPNDIENRNLSRGVIAKDFGMAFYHMDKKLNAGSLDNRVDLSGEDEEQVRGGL